MPRVAVFVICYIHSDDIYKTRLWSLDPIPQGDPEAFRKGIALW